MQNIFEVHPPVTEVPTEALRRQVLRLHEVAIAEAQRSKFITKPDNFRSKYYSHLDLAPKPIGLDIFKGSIMAIAARENGIKGPIDNARNELDYWANRACAANYPTESPTFQLAFYYFLMAVVTEGFVGKDTTGTQIGYHADEGLRGMGFSETKKT